MTIRATITQPDLSRHKPPRERANVMLITRNLDNPEEMTRKVINWRSRDDREWLNSQHAHWAMCNGYSLTLTPLTDEEVEEARAQGVKFSL